MRAGAIRATAHSKPAVARNGLAYPSGMVVGIAVMYFLDPSQGRRRRHMSRDRALKVLRRTRREVARKARHEEGVAEGRLHEVRGDSIARPQPDDITLARKVESQIFRDADAPKGSVNVNAEHGIVYLRGQAGSQEWMERLIAAAQGVEGVKDVKNLLHVAGKPRPRALPGKTQKRSNAAILPYGPSSGRSASASTSADWPTADCTASSTMSSDRCSASPSTGHESPSVPIQPQFAQTTPSACSPAS